ncbi:MULTISPECIES: fimbrial protein [Providencia]|uniref:Fimbrial protein n=1 Tax=Providencia rettgeri TaxID=587 RepID=A0AAD2ZJF7_PRORE|nr:MULTISPECIES: fimbrial protein [Providencia]ELR5075056.1 fimbrial protein [Providencia stuartii]ELR5218882.1 fimbrial protein [Providencia rettgeri]ELR5221939.1 fimbrial protein [Providencia rettgeri]MDX7321669.1 fimbrial protein [Providencia rettgeri]HEC8325393.1 fimbrial protein [Providencia rettgeri]
MNTINWLSKFILCFLCFSFIAKSDVLIDVSATLVDPACHLRSEDNSTPLKIHFGVINIPHNSDDISQSHTFPLYLTGCNWNKALGIMINPKNSNTMVYQGKNILSTDTDGLGININNITGGVAHPLEVNQIQQIFPEQIDATLQRIILQADLVSTLPASQLRAGKFSAIAMISVTYY